MFVNGSGYSTSLCNLTLDSIAQALGGVVSNGEVHFPGPGHSPIDRSASLRLDPRAPNGFMVHSFGSDDFRALRDFVKAKLGIRPLMSANPVAGSLHNPPDNQVRIARNYQVAMAIWNSATDPRGTLVERYLSSRGLMLPSSVCGAVLRFHPACPWGSSRAPAMIALYRSINGDKPAAIHRTALTAQGEKIGRKMLGSTVKAAVKLDTDESIAGYLTVGEGIETCLAARQMGFRPVWALGSVSRIRTLHLITGITTICALHERGDGGASSHAIQELSTRWKAAGRQIDVIQPLFGDDLNDALRGVRA